MTSQTSTPAGIDRPTVHVVAAPAELRESTAMRLLRTCEARLHLLDIGRTTLDHLVVDLHAVREISPSVAVLLDRLNTESACRRVGFHVVGIDAATRAAAPQDRPRLAGLSSFPDLATALATLDPGHPGGAADRRAVDPDALLVVDRPVSIRAAGPTVELGPLARRRGGVPIRYARP